MKITLDITDLLANGQLTPAEAERLKGLAAKDTGTLGVNILLAFGTVAVSLGLGVLVPSVYTAIALGALLFGVGLALTLARQERWDVFAQVCMVVGALAFLGGVSVFSNGSFLANIVLTLLTAAAAILARSGLLAAIAVIALAATTTTAYTGWTPGGATVITIVVLMALTLVLYLASLRLPAYDNLAVVAMRTAILMTNFAFLFGSIFGDIVLHLPAQAFSIAWALLLIVFGLWAIRVNRRWVVNICAVFGGIHFFVQWFWHLGASPFSILGGGLLLIAFGFGLKALNDKRLSAAPVA